MKTGAPRRKRGGELAAVAAALRPYRWVVEKTRAHRVRADAEAAGDLDRWSGNDVADWAADFTLRAASRATLPARERAAAARRGQRATLRLAVARLTTVRRRAGVPPPPPARRTVAALRCAASVLPPAEPHSWRWHVGRARFRCDGCGRCVRRLPPPANRCLRTHPALARILAGAAGLGHSVHACAVQGRHAGVLAVCARCGAHGAECVRRLGRPCPRRLDGRGGSLRALSAGRHPSCRQSWIERAWDPGAVAAAVGGSLPAGAPPGNPPDPGDPALASQPAFSPPGEEWELAELLAFHGASGFDA